MLVAAILLGVQTPVATPATPAPNAPRANEGIECRLVLSLDYAFEDRWNHMPADAGPQISTVSSVVRKQSFTAYSFLTGFVADAKGDVLVDGDFRIARPDGSTWSEHKGIAILKERDAASSTLLSRSNLRASFEPGDPLGEYAVSVTVRDIVAKTTVTATEKIRLVSFPGDVRFGTKADALDWLQTYCRAPKPNEAVEAFLTLSRSGLLAAGPMSTRAWAFFVEVFWHNEHLFPVLLARYAKEEKGEKDAILRLVARTGRDAADFLGKLDPSERESHARMAAEPRRDVLNEPVTDPMQLETLWGIFLASGSYTPLLRVCEAIGDAEDEGLRSAPKAGEREAIRRAAKWMISTNSPARPLVRSYCRWVLDNESLPEPAPGEIEAILEKSK